jgi:hypothetical protein
MPRTARAAALCCAALLLAACGSGGGTATSASPSSSSASPAASSSSAAPSPSESESPSETPSGGITTLPESVLATIPGLEYTDSGVSDDERIDKFASAVGDNDAVTGFLAREITYEGDLVGGIEVIRFAEEVPSAVGSQFIRSLLVGFVGGKGTPKKVSGTDLVGVDKKDGSIGAVAWIDGADVYIVWSQSASDAAEIALEYQKAAG